MNEGLLAIRDASCTVAYDALTPLEDRAVAAGELLRVALISPRYRQPSILFDSARDSPKMLLRVVFQQDRAFTGISLRRIRLLWRETRLCLVQMTHLRSLGLHLTHETQQRPESYI